MERTRIPAWGAMTPTSSIHDSDIAAIRLPKGVQSPIRMSSPAAMPKIAGVMVPFRGPGTRHVAPCASSEPPIAKRRTSRPQPGQPFGNMEKRRCTRSSPADSDYARRRRLETLIRAILLLLFRVSRGR
jgi:hypothetical protein